MNVPHFPDVIHAEIPRANPAMIDSFREHDVAKISDSMAKYGSFHSAIKPLRDGMRICGIAVTVRCAPGDFSALEKAAAFVQPGDVLVVDAGGFEQLAVCGAALCRKLIQAGCGGLVVDGAVRDKTALISSGLPIFARATSSRRMQIVGEADINVPINGAGLVVYPGDLIVGDDDGVVAVPGYDLERVLALTRAKLAKELSNQSKILAGAVMTDLYGCEAKLDKWREPKTE